VATKLGALGEFFSPGLTLTVPGADGTERDYVVPLVSAELGLWCRLTAAGEREQLPELPDGDMTLTQRVLGSAYDQMRADGVADVHIEFCSETAYIWIISGEEAAELYWKSGGDPERLARGNRADRRAAAKAGGTSTAGDGETKPPASTSGTRSRRKSRRGSRPR
jgi:hypothetical protein